MTRRLVLATLSALMLTVCASSAFAQAGTGGGSKPVAQASPSECQVGQICEIDQSPGLIEQSSLPVGADPPGHMLRSLVMLVIFAGLFAVYVLWAFQRGTTHPS